MNIQAEKALLIEQFKQVDDIDLIRAIRSLLNSANHSFSSKNEIPIKDQELVLERFNNVRKNPETLIDWEDAKRILSSK